MVCVRGSGSSPLTRGKRRGNGAGTRWLRAHPRSRGENPLRTELRVKYTGSSPLTRGKPPPGSPRPQLPGLIPAHAGKTQSKQMRSPGAAAHPRSRGENPLGGARQTIERGSSPLTRGKLGAGGGDRSTVGLIPAHAGKTVEGDTRSALTGAHPRSRGENTAEGAITAGANGSSPLTRGKRPSPANRTSDAGLIPAHAGKTRSPGSAAPAVTAHPRSRGENEDMPARVPSVAGSSPLTRGKRKPAARRGEPALAHPRSRGENLHLQPHPGASAGSSPLTRGKQRPSANNLTAGGLIPAHAGKTRGHCHTRTNKRAHPRSRGENPRGRSVGVDGEGSSPLTRGKPP